MTSQELEISFEPGSRVRALVALPERSEWNGRLVGLGTGGAAGRIDADRAAALASSGYAAVTSDLGTAPDPRRRGVLNPAVWRDFGHRATHWMAVAAKDVVKSRFGCLPDFSYFMGASTGGQQALSVAQRHPGDFDGILAEVPAHERVALHAYFLWNWRAIVRPDGSNRVSERQLRVWRDAARRATAAADPLDAAAAGLYAARPAVWTPALFEEVMRAVEIADPTVGPEQRDAFCALAKGPPPVVAPDGSEACSFGGLPPGAQFGRDDAFRNLYPFEWALGEAFDSFESDYSELFAKATAALSPDLDAVDPDISAFAARGGKLMLVAGALDGICPWHSAARWHRAAAERAGGAENLRSFCRFWVLPGREHGGGPGFSTLRFPLRELARWRERGVDPPLEAVRFGGASPKFLSVPEFSAAPQLPIDGNEDL